MANSLYDRGREKFAIAQLDWSTHTVKAQLVDTGTYTANLAAHEFLSDLPVGARIGAAVTLTGKSYAAGACDATDATFTAVSGPTIEAIVIYRDTGTEATSALIAYIDSATGLPITPNSGDIIVAWDNGANKIFKL
jgi:hypothetical protein